MRCTSRGSPVAGELVYVSLRLLYHEVHVEGQPRGPSYRLDNKGAYGNVRHEPAVHDVDVDVVGAGPLYGVELFAEPGEIS